MSFRPARHALIVGAGLVALAGCSASGSAGWSGSGPIDAGATNLPVAQADATGAELAFSGASSFRFDGGPVTCAVNARYRSWSVFVSEPGGSKQTLEVRAAGDPAVGPNPVTYGVQFAARSAKAEVSGDLRTVTFVAGLRNSGSPLAPLVVKGSLTCS